MGDKATKILLENLLARIIINPETGLGELSGFLTPMEIASLERAKVLLMEKETNALHVTGFSDL